MQLYLPCCKHTATHISCAYMIPVDSGINCDSLQRAAADIVAICIWLLYELQLHKRCGRRGRNGGLETRAKGTTETPRPNARTSSFLASSRELVSKFELTTRKLRSLGGCHNRRAELKEAVRLGRARGAQLVVSRDVVPAMFFMLVKNSTMVAMVARACARAGHVCSL